MSLALPRRGAPPEPPPLSPWASPALARARIAINRLYHHATHKPLAPASDADLLRIAALNDLTEAEKEIGEMRRIYTKAVKEKEEQPHDLTHKVSGSLSPEEE